MTLTWTDHEIVIHYKVTAKNRDGSVFKTWPSVTLNEFYQLKAEHKGKTLRAVKLNRPGYLPRAS